MALSTTNTQPLVALSPHALKKKRGQGRQTSNTFLTFTRFCPEPGQSPIPEAIVAALCNPWQAQIATEAPCASHQMLRLRAFLRLVDERYMKNDTVVDYCKELCISESHLGRICREKLGISPKHCIDWRRLIAAVKRLVANPMPVHEVAAQSGFHDPAYFSRFMKKYTGICPLAIRQSAG